jgi:hypothetical protein
MLQELRRLREALGDHPLVQRLEQLAARRRETYQRKVAELRETFQINTWSLGAERSPSAAPAPGE